MILLFRKSLILQQIFHRRFRIPNFININFDKIHIYIIYICIRNRFVFKKTFPFIIHQLHTFIKRKLLRLVSHSHKNFICLIRMHFHAGLNMHKQYMICSAFKISTWYLLYFCLHRRYTKIKRYSQKFIDFPCLIVNVLNSSCLIRNSNGYCTAIRIRKCNNRYRQRFRIYMNTLSIKYLRFFSRQYFFNRHIISPLSSLSYFYVNPHLSQQYII